MDKKILAALSVVIMCLAGPLSSKAEEESELRNILVQKEPGRLVVTIQTAQAVTYESFTLLSPNRLIFDIQDTTSFAVEPLIAVNHVSVQSIRTAQNRPGVVRVVFDCGAVIPPYAISDSSDGIVVTFREPEPEPDPEPVRGVVPVAAKTETPKPAPVKPKAAPGRKSKPTPPATEPGAGRMLAAGLQAGLYMMQDDDFKDFYGASQTFLGGEGAYFFFLNGKEAVGVSLDFKLINAEGQTSFLEEDIKLRLIPFSLSASYMSTFGPFMPYAALGADFLFYKETYPIDFSVPEISGSTLGLNIALGTYVTVSDNILLKAFVKLHSLKAKIDEDLTANFGGTEFGASVCYRFNF